MLVVALVAVAGVGCVAVSVARAVKVRRLASWDPDQTTALVRRKLTADRGGTAPADPRGVLAAVLDRIAPGSPGQAVLRAVVEGGSREHVVAELNEVLNDFAAAREVGAHVPRSVARIALATGALAAMVEVARTLPTDAGVRVEVPLGAFAVGLVAAVLSGLAGRAADRTVRTEKASMRALVREVMRAAPSPASGADGSVRPRRCLAP